MFFLWAVGCNWIHLSPVGLMLNVLFVCLFTLYGLSQRDIIPANHRWLSLPSSASKSLEKVIVYKAASGKEQNSWKPTGLWLELGPTQYRTSSVIGGGPFWKTRGIIEYKILPVGSSFVDKKMSFFCILQSCCCKIDITNFILSHKIFVTNFFID